MFYSQFILAKKGPLGTIWIAAHLERKLRKNQVADTDIGVSVDSILCPDVPIALRLSSHLLLGVVRIYSRKVNYLFDDCSDALLKVKQAFRSTAVDLPPEQSKAPYHSITLPETFDLDDFELPDNEIFHGNDRHVSTRDQITLQDTMDGAAFTTSQFGPDERFGDGDASQIGLDLDEDLFLEKEEAAGTSGILNSTDADQPPGKDATSFKDDEHNEGVSDLPLASTTNYSSIQAPSTPGLMEEPNLPSAEEALISDDHMDEDQNIPESAAKEVFGTTSSQVEPSSVQSLELNSNGNSRHLDEEDNGQGKPERPIAPDEAAVEITSHGAHTLMSSEQIEATSDVDILQSKLDYRSPQNDANVASDIQSPREHYEHDETSLNRPEDAIFTEVNDQDTCPDNLKADRNGSYLPDSDIRSDNNNKSSFAQEVTITEASKTVLVNNGDQRQESDHPCQNLQNSEYNESEKLSILDTPVLKPCNSHSHNTFGVEKLPDASKLSATDDELCPLGLSSRQDAANATEISTDIHELTTPSLKADQIAHKSADATTNSFDKPLDNDSLGEEHLARENNSKISDFSEPEKLLAMPNLSAGQPDSVVIEATPYIDVVARNGDSIEVLTKNDDASFENLLSGKKRSYTESTLTIQSLNSAASSGAAQSKQSAELVPEDDDLLSSILGGRSTTFKLKPTPPAADSLPAKRQRTSVRSSAQKRKVVVMDDSMVLHGDMIREQLTNTEDIRRVRTKAPCTRLEVWVLQKQFLEEEVFNEPIFTGYLPEFRCLHSQPRDLSGIRIVQDDGNEGVKEMDTSKLMHAEGGENETLARYESMFEVDALQKELETFDNEIAKQMSKHDVPSEKADMENNNQAGFEGNQLVVSTAELASSVSHVPEVSCNVTDNDKVDTPQLHETTDVVVPADINKSHQLINQDYQIELTKEDASTVEEVSGSGRQSHEVDANVDGELVGKSLLDEREGDVEADAIVFMEGDGELDGKSLLDNREGDVKADSSVYMEVDEELDDKSLLDEREDLEADTIEFMENIPTTYSVDLEGRASPTSDSNMKERQLSEPRFENEEEVIVYDIRHGDDFPMSNNILEEDVTLEPSCIVLETDLCSEDDKLNEKEDSRCLEREPTLETDPVATPTVFINPEDQSDLGAEFIEHDTDFLNVDDDDAAEDYEDDTANPEEKRMLDNTGWSSRTRAVANYLQGLFENDTRHAKKVIPLESLLVGKTRKEASRMFFETLVLKTKDYIDAEQADSFCEIKIKAKGKLMKSEF